MTDVKRTESIKRTTRWPGWIWSVPIAAIALVVWLLIRAVSGTGIKVTVVFDDAQGMTANGTDVICRGVKVGSVTDIELSKDRRHVDVSLSIDRDMKSVLNAGTTFYLQGAHASLGDLSSLKSIVSGPKIVLVPGQGQTKRHFVASSGAVPDSISTAARYLVRLEGAVGELEVGSPVTMRGFMIGHVTRVGLAYEPNTGALATSVEIGLDPSRLGVSRSTMDATMSTLVGKGLRARLAQSPPLIGAPAVELATAPGVRTQALAMVNGEREIPGAPAFNLNRFMARVGEFPIEDIGTNVRAITSRVRSLVSAPALPSAIDHLDGTLATLDSTMRTVGPALPPMIQQLGKTASELDATVASVRRVTGESPAAPDGNLRDALRELTGAARAMRSLANFLDQHPEALVSGRQR